MTLVPFQALVPPAGGAAGGPRAVPPPGAGGGLLPGVPVQHPGVAAGRGAHAPPTRGGRRDRAVLPAAGPQGQLLHVQVGSVPLCYQRGAPGPPAPCAGRLLYSPL